MQKEIDPIDQLLEKIVREADKPEINYATFLQRVFARLIDTIILLSISYACWLACIGYVKNDIGYDSAFVIKSMQWTIPAFALVLWSLFYSPVMEATGGTIRKRIMRIKLVDPATMKTPYFRDCVARSIIYLIFVVLLIAAVLSCLAIFISDEKQTWHDKLSGLICIKLTKKR